MGRHSMQVFLCKAIIDISTIYIHRKEKHSPKRSNQDEILFAEFTVLEKKIGKEKYAMSFVNKLVFFHCMDLFVCNRSS
jgi:hypothetical protein